MTLKDKFDETLTYLESKNKISELEQIADEYAIGFAEWCIKWRVEFVDDTREGVLYNYGGLYKKLTMNEILEIYKKEKGL